MKPEFTLIHFLRNKKKGFKVTLLCFAVTTIIETNAQTSSDIPEFMAPDVWSFMKYGNDNPSLYTGTVKVDIPIYTYRDNNFEIPVNVSYGSNGFIPNVHSGSLGLGWFLDAGGCITREIVGEVDEKGLYYSSVYDEYIKGYYSYSIYPNKPFLDKPLLERGDFVDPTFIFFQNFNNRKPRWESESDIYTFNFMGHSGKFMIGPNGIHVFNTSLPQGGYKIDLSDFNHEESITINGAKWSHTKESKIIITTEDGYKYTFGNLIKYANADQTLTKTPRLDDYRITKHANKPYSDKYPTESSVSRSDNYQLKTWMLIKVESPNGHIIKFEYSDPEFVASMKFSGQMIDQSGQYYYKVPLGMASGSYSNNNYFDDVFSINKYETATVQLTRILVDNNFEIKFTYKDREKEETWKYYYGGYNLELLKGSKQLSKIVVRNLLGTAQTLKECNLSYGYPKSTGNNVLFLKDISILGEGSYKMNYINETSDFPFQGTAAYDNWGYFNYYNANSDNTYATTYAILKNVTVDANYREIQNDPYRNPNFSGARYGMLEKLIYPTGGHTIYEYAPHDYSSMVSRDYSSQNKPTLRACSKTIAGGVRVKKITDYASDGNIGNSREFIYDESIAGESLSTGNLLHMPRYWFQSEIKVKSGSSFTTKLITIRSITDLQAFSASKNHMEYKTVYEKFSDGSYIKYNFSNYATIPDKIDINNCLELKAGGTISYEILFPQYANNYLAHPISLSSQRGKLTSKYYYKSDNTITKHEEYVYNINSNLTQLESVKATWPGGNIIYAYKTYVGDFPLIKSNLYEHLNNSILGQTINYTYNAQGQITGQETLLPDGNKIMYNTQYVSDIPSASRTSIDNIMISRNIVKYPIKQKTSVSKSGGAYKMTEGTMNSYALSNNLIIFDKVSSTKLTTPITCLDYSFNSYLTVDESYLRNNQGNIVQCTDISGTTTTYLWGYNNMYPIVSIRNATLSQVQNIIGSAQINSIASSSTLTSNQLSLLQRLRNQIANTEVTIYLYKPNVGISRIIDPTGRNIYYEYDSQNRLQALRDDQYNLINRYEYHFNNTIYY